ncbi:MAG: type II toxin-antitoxin system PemK/MazF family toxin [Planctomycetes bacterium]|jgi:mRNA interferase MazF|nr:type II toxin-antitoxin system PemK/MazF family toxin [Planctomycetota bacterium]
MPIQRGEIYFVNLNPVKGREQAGLRPVLVLSNDTINQSPLVVTVVIGTKGANVTRDYSTNVRVPSTESGLPTETVFLGFQVRSIDPSRFGSSPAGSLSDAYMKKIEDAVRACLDL